jgi:1-acyl-sn-glycerol-3-phosphate acyltransferase
LSQSEINTVENTAEKMDRREESAQISPVAPPSMPEWGLETVRFVGRSLSRLFFGIKYINQENIPQTRSGGLLICANHQTYFDPFWICFPIKRSLRYMAWDEATRWFLVGDFIKSLGAFPVNVERGGKDALKMSLGWLRSGGSLVVFPEGTRGFADGKMLEFKPGAVRIALQTGVPILPVTVRGGNKIWSQEMKSPKLGKVEIVYHPLWELPPVPEGSDIRLHAEKLTLQLAEIIASELPEVD